MRLQVDGGLPIAGVVPRRSTIDTTIQKTEGG